ncbi:MAG: hypothetical protein KGJ56_09030, partial [Gammaproteobacteria bacterium]|nr:hypothetical protein [Gammaproteobacteria bacterium]
GGDVWVANQGSSSVSEFDSSGAAISPAGGYTGGGIDAPAGLALDPAGNVWISDYYTNSVTELLGGNTPPASCPQTPAPGDSGCPLSPAGGFTGGGLDAPNSVAVDSAGNVFITNFHGQSITELDAGGQALSPTAGYGDASLVLPSGIATDPSGNVWVADFGDDLITKFIGLATPVKTPLLGAPAHP